MSNRKSTEPCPVLETGASLNNATKSSIQALEATNSLYITSMSAHDAATARLCTAAAGKIADGIRCLKEAGASLRAIDRATFERMRSVPPREADSDELEVAREEEQWEIGLKEWREWEGDETALYDRQYGIDYDEAEGYPCSPEPSSSAVRDVDQQLRAKAGAKEEDGGSKGKNVEVKREGNKRGTKKFVYQP